MGSPFCSTCGGFIAPGSKHSSKECKERVETNNQEYSNDTDTEQFKQPKRGWLVAYFQPIEDRDRFPNLHVYKCGHIDVAKGHVQAVIQKGTKWFSGVYVTFNQPYEKSGSKKELRLTKGILYHNVEKMSVKRPFDIPHRKGPAPFKGYSSRLRRQIRSKIE
jgi:hypothetical protein